MNLTFTHLTHPTNCRRHRKMVQWPSAGQIYSPEQKPGRARNAHAGYFWNTAAAREEHQSTYLIYADDDLVGELSFQIDPAHLYKKDTSTAWLGILIGEESARGKGVGVQAMQYLEEQIQTQGLNRIELGVFEFNTRALQLYRNLGYQEIARIDDFTYWDGKMWQDIRMEKYLAQA